MVELPALDPSEAPRARRWDALILGSGISALVAAARIGAAGQRVLVVEEGARATLPPALKEPFFLAGLRDEGVLDACLKTLSVPLIDRRRIAAERLAYQIAADPVRIDVGQAAVTAEELVAWGLAKPDEAQTLVRELLESSKVERSVLLESPVVRLGRRVAGSRATQIGHHRRGLPGIVRGLTGLLADLVAAQLRALSNLGQSAPPPESQARLLGIPLAGGAGFADEPPWLCDLLRKRVAASYGDFRTLNGDFDLVSVSGQPGVRVRRTGEIWLGRTLVLAAAPSALRDHLQETGAAGPSAPPQPVPGILSRGGARAYRAAFLFSVPTAILPEGMSARLILPAQDADHPTTAITAFPSQTHGQRVDLVARAVVPDRDPERLARVQQGIAQRLRQLMPFCRDTLGALDVEMPRWDGDDGWLEDPAPGMGWPAELDLRISQRPSIYHLDRAAVGALGLEGDLLLGWRGGEAIAAELS
ncbi:MAG: NAD(P)/FAD-dependent oxidoreductase [Deltaproteobacteria bacterium]|nr:NAD(P)/FAD-dependent oxidoreductase [Deltaproteobacteria bacterium]